MKNKDNKIEFNPFLVFSNQLKVQLAAAKASENPALYLYQNGARNVIFMLEGLTRLHKEAFGSQKMEKWYDRFKVLEDLLGQFDYYDVLKTQFESEKMLDEQSLQILATKATTALSAMNDVLATKNWFTKKLSKFDAFIAEENYKYNEKYTTKLKTAYNADVKEIVEFATEIKFKMKEVENELHELRRKLRWLSIYPQAMMGVFQLQKAQQTPDWANKYMTENVLNSPFNQLEKTVEEIAIISLDYHCFVALSFVIQSFGELKDKGLKSELLATEFNFSAAKIKKILGANYVTTTNILAGGSALLATFFEDKVLEQLVK